MWLVLWYGSNLGIMQMRARISLIADAINKSSMVHWRCWMTLEICYSYILPESNLDCRGLKMVCYSCFSVKKWVLKTTLFFKNMEPYLIQERLHKLGKDPAGSNLWNGLPIATGRYSQHADAFADISIKLLLLLIPETLHVGYVQI